MRVAGRAVVYGALAAAISSFVAMILTFQWDAALRFGLVSALIIVARSARVPTPFAAAFAALLLFATWAAVAHWYQQVSLLDALVHFFTPGSLAAVGYYMLVQVALLPDASETRRLRAWAPILWVTSIGATSAVVWEFYEWTVEQMVPAQVQVGYTDTVVDLFAGMLGSSVAGGLVLAWAHRHADSRPEAHSARTPPLTDTG